MRIRELVSARFQVMVPVFVPGLVMVLPVLVGVLALVLVLVLMLAMGSESLQAAELNPAGLGELGLDEIMSFSESLEQEARALLPGLDLDMESLLSGQSLPGAGDVLSVLLKYFFKEIVYSLRLLGQLVVLAVLCAVMVSLQDSFGSKGPADAALVVCSLVLVYVGFQSFKGVLEIGRAAVSDMVSFMQALLPVFTALLIAVGAVGSAALINPAMLAMTAGIGTLMESTVIPLVSIGAVLGVVGNLWQGSSIGRLAALARQGAVVVVGAFFSIFLGVIAVRGSFAPVADGAALRTAKFMTGAFVPVIGGMFADAVEVVASGSLLIKNAVGAFGLVMIGLMAAFPLIKIASVIVIFKLAGALLGPISDERLSGAISSMENSMTVLFVCVGLTAVLFFFSITVLTGAANVAVMLR